MYHVFNFGLEIEVTDIETSAASGTHIVGRIARLPKDSEFMSTDKIRENIQKEGLIGNSVKKISMFATFNQHVGNYVDIVLED